MLFLHPLPSTGPVASGEALFGEGSGQILLDDVQCTGNESRLDNCTHDGFTVNNCDHSEDAGVDCMGRLPPTPCMFTCMMDCVRTHSRCCLARDIMHTHP